MRIDSPEIPIATSIENISDTSSSLQHGTSRDNIQASDGSPHLGLVRELSSASDAADDASVASSATSRGRRANPRRMSSRGPSSHGSPGSQIDAYERAHAITRKPSDGMIFQVVPSSGNTDANVSVLDLPNGTYCEQSSEPKLTKCRGSDTHPVASSARIVVFDELGQHSLSSTCHNPTSVEDCLRSLLPRLRVYRPCSNSFG